MACGPENSGPRGDLPPDIFLFTVDALRADHLSPYGHARQTTPFLASIAEDGVVFEHASATTSWTVPSVASILTGMMPHQLGVTRVKIDDAGTEEKLPSTAITLAERLKAQDYQTYAVTSNALLSGSRGYDQGFDHYVNVGFEDADGIARALAPLEDELRRSARPTFLWVHLFDPHDPYDAKDPWIAEWDASHADYTIEPQSDADKKPLRELTMASLRKRSDLRRGQGGLPHLLALYDSEIRFTDQALGKLYDRLDIDEDDLFIFTADHGEEFRDHSALGHHLNLFEETVRVPLIVHWPAELSPGRRDQRVSLLQLTPTLAEVAGASVGPYGGVSTRSLMPLLRGHPSPETRPVLIDVTQIGGKRLMGIYDGQLKLIVHEDDPTRVQLFDLFTDPTEKRNRASDMPTAVTRLTHTLHSELNSLPVLEPEVVADETPAAVLEELKAMGYIE